MTREQAGYVCMEEYKMRVEGWQQRERCEWERTRWQAFMMMRMHPYMKQKPNTPQAWVRFPWEKETPKQNKKNWKTTEAEAKAVMEIFNEFNKKNG